MKTLRIFALYINNSTNKVQTKIEIMKNLINIFEFDFIVAEADFSLGKMRTVKFES
jgi:hypothetical protein